MPSSPGSVFARHGGSVFNRRRHEEENRRREEQNKRDAERAKAESERTRREAEQKEDSTRRDAERKEKRQEEKRREWDRREADYREKQREVWTANAERQAQAGSLAAIARDLLSDARSSAEASGASARSSIASSFQGLELAMNDTASPSHDADAMTNAVLDGLSGIGSATALASRYVPALTPLSNLTGLTSIPMGLTSNVFRANFRALDDLRQLNITTATVADTDRIFDRHIQASFGPIVVLSTILKQPANVVQASMLAHFGVSEAMQEAYDDVETLSGLVDRRNDESGRSPTLTPSADAFPTQDAVNAMFLRYLQGLQ